MPESRIITNGTDSAPSPIAWFATVAIESDAAWNVTLSGLPSRSGLDLASPDRLYARMGHGHPGRPDPCRHQPAVDQYHPHGNAHLKQEFLRLSSSAVP